MSRQERRHHGRAAKTAERDIAETPSIPVIALNAETILVSDNEELSTWRQQLEGYRKLSSYSNTLTRAGLGLMNTLRFSDGQVRALFTSDDPADESDILYNISSRSPLERNEYIKLMKPVANLLKRQPYSDDAIDDLNEEYTSGNLPTRDYLSLLRTYTFQMQQAMQVYVDVLTPEKVKKSRDKKKDPRSKAINDMPDGRDDEVTAQIQQVSSQPESPFPLAGKTVLYTTKPWSTKDKDLVEMDTSNRDAYSAQLRKLVAGNVDSKPSSLGKAIEVAFTPDAFDHIKKAGLRYSPEGVDERWLRIKRGQDRIGLLPLREESGVPLEAIVFAGHRAWVYDRVTD